MTEILEIACDESGHTGPNLLQKVQRYFTYASVAIGDTEAFAIIQKARTAHPVQMPELKASALMGSAQGRRLIASLLRDIEGRYTVSLYDKLLSLCAWFFEYIYEPVYRDDPSLLYAKNLHRFIAMYSNGISRHATRRMVSRSIESPSPTFGPRASTMIPPGRAQAAVGRKHSACVNFLALAGQCQNG